MKNEFVIHAIPGSPFSRSALIALEEKGAHYRIAAVTAGSLRAPEHLSLHPFGRVPILDHGDFRLYETQAILRYIERVLPEPALTPSDAQAAARMDQLMNINDWYLFHGVSNVIVFQRIVGPRVLGLTTDEAAITAALPKARMVFDVLAGQLGSKPFLVGDRLTLADILIAPELDMFRETPEWEPLTRPHANLRNWIARMAERPSMAATTWERVSAMAVAA